MFPCGKVPVSLLIDEDSAGDSGVEDMVERARCTVISYTVWAYRAAVK
jgi:hypothetical protein